MPASRITCMWSRPSPRHAGNTSTEEPMPDAVVIGAGPNGLVAANLLADRGWDVTVLEAQPVPGGGVHSSEFVERGFVSDHCSAFYPLTVASRAMTSLRLEEHGLRWRHAPLVLAHPTEDDGPVVLSRDV